MAEPDTVRDGGARRWQNGVEPALRRRVVDMILGKLVQVCEGKPAPSSSLDLNRIATSLELKIFSEANSEEDYVNRIVHKLFIMEWNWQPVLRDASGLSQSVKMGCQSQPVNRVQAIHCGNSPTTTTQVSPTMNSHERQSPHMQTLMRSFEELDWKEEKFQQMGTPDFQAEDLQHDGGETPVAKKPIDRLIIALHTSSPEALKSSANSICSVISMHDWVAHPEFNTFQHCIFSSMLGGAPPQKKMKRPFDITTLDSESSTLSDIWEIEANAEPGAKMLKNLNARGAILDEIESTNRMLMDTIISVAHENRTDRITSISGGMLIELSYTAVSLAPDLKTIFSASKMPIVTPTKLLVPGEYPRSSPVLVIDRGVRS